MIEGIDYPSKETLAAWADCKVSGCPNKCCLRLDSIYCWPHTKAGITENELMDNLKTPEPA